MCRIVKGVFEERPSLPKYQVTWGVNSVLTYLESFPSLHDLTLKQLKLKTCMLLALVMGQRCHALHSIKMEDVRLYDKKCVISFSEKLKTTKPGCHIEAAELAAFNANT